MHLSLFASIALAAPCLIDGATALTPEQARAGRVDGFVGLEQLRDRGDVVTSSFCFCEQKYELRDANVPDIGHVYAIEYFNVHANATYFLTHMCVGRSDDAESAKKCQIDYTGRGIVEREGEWKQRIARTFQRTHGQPPDINRPDDVIQYAPNQVWEIMYNPTSRPGNYLGWNGQWRLLSNTARQGYREWEDDRVQEFCQTTCQDFLTMDVAWTAFEANQDFFEGRIPHGESGHWENPSYQIIFSDLDDMCDECKGHKGF